MVVFVKPEEDSGALDTEVTAGADEVYIEAADEATVGIEGNALLKTLLAKFIVLAEDALSPCKADDGKPYILKSPSAARGFAADDVDGPLGIRPAPSADRVEYELRSA